MTAHPQPRSRFRPLRGARRWLGVGAALALLVVTGCTAAPGDDRAALRVQTCAAGGLLIPAASIDECTERVLDPVMARLTHVDAEGEVHLDLAESLSSSDGQTWTVELADRTFSDGTPVLAANFVDAWNWSASCAQSYRGAASFRDIVGYDRLQPDGPCPFHTEPVQNPRAGDEERIPSASESAPDDGGAAENGSGNEPSSAPTSGASTPGGSSSQDHDGAGTGQDSSPAPSASGNVIDDRPDHPQLAGLAVTGERSFTIALDRPIQDFDERLAALPFAPLPDSFWVDPGHYGDVPVGAGPYQMVENNARRHVVQRWDGYTGPVAGTARTISFEIWRDQSLAYAAVDDGEMDVTDVVPVESLADGTWHQEFGDRATTSDQTATLTQLVVAAGDPALQDVRRRQALSMAVDRGFVTGRIMEGSRTPAAGWVPPQLSGSADSCGAYCRYSEFEAQSRWQEAEDASGSSPSSIQVTYAADGGQSQWVDELCTTWKWVLDVDCDRREVTRGALANIRPDRGVVVVDRATNRDSAADFLAPFTQGHPRNVGGYGSQSFDQAITAADATDEPTADRRAAQAQLAEDLPSIPLWWNSPTVVWSESVTIPDPPATRDGRANVLGTTRD